MENSPASPSVTQLLQRWGEGDKQALDELMPIVYSQLRRLASRSMRAEREEHTLSATALVHEAYLQGDKEKARKAYEDFFALWKDADPDVPILNQAKDEYAMLR